MLLPTYNVPTISHIKLRSLDGEFCHIEENKNVSATIIFFISPECPLCKNYSLNIKQLSAQYLKKGFRFIAIVPGNRYTIPQVKEYKTTYGLKNISFYFDPNFELVHMLKAKVTPEVFVLDQTGKLVYNGRIDNWVYELGKKRKVITEHNLADVLFALDQHIIVTYKSVKALGCFIE